MYTMTLNFRQAAAWFAKWLPLEKVADQQKVALFLMKVIIQFFILLSSRLKILITTLLIWDQR